MGVPIGTAPRRLAGTSAGQAPPSVLGFSCTEMLQLGCACVVTPVVCNCLHLVLILSRQSRVLCGGSVAGFPKYSAGCRGSNLCTWETWVQVWKSGVA